MCRDFYSNLRKEVHKDFYEVQQEADESMEGASSFGRWEGEYLDHDGGAKGIEAWTARQWDLDNPPADIFEKYGHLAPKRYVESREKGGVCSEPHRIPCADIWCDRADHEAQRSVPDSDDSLYTGDGSLSSSDLSFESAERTNDEPLVTSRSATKYHEPVKYNLHSLSDLVLFQYSTSFIVITTSICLILNAADGNG